MREKERKTWVLKMSSRKMEWNQLTKKKKIKLMNMRDMQMGDDDHAAAGCCEWREIAASTLWLNASHNVSNVVPHLFPLCLWASLVSWTKSAKMQRPKTQRILTSHEFEVQSWKATIIIYFSSDPDAIAFNRNCEIRQLCGSVKCVPINWRLKLVHSSLDIPIAKQCSSHVRTRSNNVHSLLISPHNFLYGQHQLSQHYWLYAGSSI